MNEKQKVKLCAEFLVYCLSYGWEKTDLDRLEKIWWDSEGWKYQHPRMVMQFGSDETIFEKARNKAFDEIIAIIRKLPVYRMCAQDIVIHLEQIKRKGR